MTDLPPPAPKWYEKHENIVILATWMADQGNTAHTVVDAIETPWSYEDEFNLALAALAEQEPAEQA
jgi:hypothetical protein